MAKDYRVSWDIDVTAKNPTEAARKALEIQRDNKSLALVFDVIDKDGNVDRVDLLEEKIS